jgi:DNA-binding transcriptional LysR family regulator
MDKLRAMETFVRIVDGGSLTAAAETLPASLPAVVRLLAALEAELDARLLNRTTRRIALTDEGREYYERCKRVLAGIGGEPEVAKRVLAEVDEAEAALSARRATPKGRLRVTAPVMFGRMHVAPVVRDFLAKHGAVQMELFLVDRVVDLLEEGVDAAVRIGRLPDSSLVAIRVGQTRRVVCASSAYLKRAGTPHSPSDLARHRCFSFGSLSRCARIFFHWLAFSTSATDDSAWSTMYCTSSGEQVV